VFYAISFYFSGLKQTARVLASAGVVRNYEAVRLWVYRLAVEAEEMVNS